MTRLRKLIVKFLMDSYKNRYLEKPALQRLVEVKDYEEFFLEIADSDGRVLDEMKGMIDGSKMPRLQVPNDG